MTLRVRLVAVLAGLIAAGLLSSSFLTHSALRSFLFDRVDEQLHSVQPDAMRVLNASISGDFEVGPSSDQPIAAYAELRDASGEIVSREPFGFELGETTFVPDIPEPGVPLIGEPFTVAAKETTTYTFRVLASRASSDSASLDGGTMIVAIPLADVHDTLGRLLTIEVVLSLLLVAATALAAWILIKRELRPLDSMAEDATAIAGGDLARRVDEEDPRTEVGRLGRALNVMLEQIERAFGARRESEERMRRFLADASHELRTPLTSIRGYAELFRRGASDRPEDLRVSMRRIEDEAARMGVLVEDLLTLAHADEVRPFDPAPVDLTEIALDAASDARVRDRDRQIDVRVSGAVMVTGDESRLRQAVTNLIGNALTHTPAGSPVVVGVELEGDEAVLSVDDEGPGLTPEELEHVFDRFWRGDPSRSRGSGGAGLGLAIVDAVAWAHGGVASAENRPEGGARFSLRIPIGPSGGNVSEEDPDEVRA